MSIPIELDGAKVLKHTKMTLRGLANIPEILYGKRKLLVMCTLRSHQKGIHLSLNGTLFSGMSFGAIK